MNPDHDGVLGLAVKRGGPDIEKEATLALFLHAQIETGTAFLETGRAKMGGIAYPLPGVRWLRRLPAPITNGCCGVRHAQKCMHSTHLASFNDSLFDTNMCHCSLLLCCHTDHSASQWISCANVCLSSSGGRGSLLPTP